MLALNPGASSDANGPPRRAFRSALVFPWNADVPGQPFYGISVAGLAGGPVTLSRSDIERLGGAVIHAGAPSVLNGELFRTRACGSDVSR